MKMNEIDLSIQEVAGGDLKAYKKLSAEINGLLAGDKEVSQLSWKAQYALELAGLNNQDEIACNDGRFTFNDLVLLLR